MSKPFSLQPVRDLARRKTDDAAAALGRLKAEEVRARETLSMLEGYRNDYRVKLERALTSGIGPAELRNYQEFLSKLERAIEQQQEFVRQAETQSQTGMHAWQAQATKLKSFDVLATREDAQERRHESKREQKLLDEHTAARFRRAHDND